MATTIVKSIGSAAGRDYLTVQAFWDAIPADLVTADQAWVGELYKDSEFFATTSTTFANKVTDATRDIKLRAATGQSYIDSSTILTDPLVYNASRGVAIRGTHTTGNPLWKFPSAYVSLTGLQFSGATSIVIDGSGPNFLIENCLVDSVASGQFATAISSPGGRARNTQIILRNTGHNGVVTNTAAFRCENVTVVRPSNFARGGIAFSSGGANVFTLVNCAAFGANFSNNSHQGNNNASDGTIPSGTVKLENLVYANQFVSTTNDFRTKGGSSLVNAGTAVSSDNIKTISGNRTQGPAPDIGAWELYVVANNLLLSGIDGSVGNANPITVYTNGEITESVTVVLSVTGGGTISPSTVTLTSASSSAVVQYTASSTGTKTFSATNNKGLNNPTPLSLNFIVAPILSPTPTITGRKVYRIGAGKDFADLGAFGIFLSSANPLTQQEMIIAEVYEDQVISSRSLQYPVNASSSDYYVIIRPVKGLDVVSRSGVTEFNYGTEGIEIKVATELKIGHGVVVEGFRIDCGTTGILRIGGPQPGGSVRSVTQTGYRRNRIKFAGGLAIGEYSTVGFVTDNLILREAGVGTVRSSVNGAEVSRNTFVALNSATGSFITGDYITKIDNNVFINVGDTPISTNSPTVDNNYTNNAVAVTRKGIEVVLSSNFVVNVTSNFIPVQAGPLFGNGASAANSIVDNRLANRGIDPDVGAWQLIPAPELPSGTLNAAPLPNGQQLVISFTTANVPVSATAEVTPAVNNAGSAEYKAGTVALTTNAGTATFADLSPGLYDISISLSNTGGTTYITAIPQVLILEISGSPSATSGSTPSATVPSTPINVTATSKTGGASITGTVLSNGGSDIIEYRAVASTGQSSDSATLPVFVALPEGVTATFTLVATNSVGPSLQSAPSNSATSLGAVVLTPPSVPTVAALGGINNISVSVSQPASNGNSPITSFTVRMSTGESKTQASPSFVFDYQDQIERTAVAYATNSIGDSPLSAPSQPTSPIAPYVPVVSVTLKTSDKTFVLADTSLVAVWFDESNPLNFTAPAWKGAIVVGDGGLVRIELDTSELATGDVGWLILTDSSGAPDAFYKAFSGPVTVI